MEIPEQIGAGGMYGSYCLNARQISAEVEK